MICGKVSLEGRGGRLMVDLGKGLVEDFGACNEDNGLAHTQLIITVEDSRGTWSLEYRG